MKRVLLLLILGIVLIFHAFCVQPNDNRKENIDLQKKSIIQNDSNSQDDSIIQNLYARAKVLPLPISDTSKLNWKHSFTLKKTEEKALIKSGFKVMDVYTDFEMSINGKFDFSDNYNYLYADISSKASGHFYAASILILDLKYKILDQILIRSDGIEAPDGCEFKILADKTIKTREFYILESEKLPPNPYTLKSQGEKCYCKIIDKEYRILNGKAIENIKEPKFEYYIFDGRDFKPFVDK